MGQKNLFHLQLLNQNPTHELLSPSNLPIKIETNPKAWDYTAHIDFDLEHDENIIVILEINLIQGELEILSVSKDNKSIHKNELKISEQGLREYKMNIKYPFSDLIIRNYENDSVSICNLNSIQIFKQEIVSLNINETKYFKNLILNPEKGKHLIAKEKNINFNVIENIEILDKKVEIKLDEIFEDEIGRIILDDYYHRIALLENFNYDDVSAQLKNAEYGNASYYKIYLKQSIIRVYHLIKLLQNYGVMNGKLLEVGPLLGNFSVALSKIGFDVTAIDRYKDMGSSFQIFVEDQRSNNVRVIETRNDEEYKDIDNLGYFDVIIAMAVIEHIPHTPKHFLETIIKKIKPRGLLAIDTPNLSSYWHRVNINNDKSVFQDLEKQFNTSIPYGGHHREYTGEELIWIMENIGCSEVKLRRFDYNLLQFSSISGVHLKCLEEIIMDPTKSDTILTVGRIN